MREQLHRQSSGYLRLYHTRPLLPETIDAVHTLIAQAEALQRGVVLVGLGDPRWVAQLGLTPPTVLAWGGDRVMQQAAGRALLRSRKP